MIWGMVDQVLQIRKSQHHEGTSFESLPGFCNATILAPARVAVYIGSSLVAEIYGETVIQNYDEILEPQFFPDTAIGDRFKDTFQLEMPPAPTPKLADRAIELFNKADMAYMCGLLNRDAWLRECSKMLGAALARILNHIKSYGHGGSIVVVASNDLQDVTLKYPLRYDRLRSAIAGSAFYQNLAGYVDVGSGDTKAVTHRRALKAIGRRAASAAFEYEAELTGCIRFIASLTRVDGAVVLNRALSVLGFGVKLNAPGDVPDTYIPVTFDGRRVERSKHDISHYGTRHQSIVKYCSVHRGSVGFVVSQDGGIRATTRVGRRTVFWRNVSVQNGY